MMKSFILFLLFTSFSTLSNSETREETLSSIEKRFNNIASLSADFSEMIIPMMGDTQFFAGTIDFSRPHSLRMEITTPEQELIVYDGKNACVYLPDEKYCIIYNVETEMSMKKLPEYIFDPFKSLTVDSLNTGTKFIHLHFSTKDTKDLFDIIILKISKDKLLPLSLIFHDKTGNKTVYDLTNIRINSDKIVDFTFTPPLDVEVIEK